MIQLAWLHSPPVNSGECYVLSYVTVEFSVKFLKMIIVPFFCAILGFARSLELRGTLEGECLQNVRTLQDVDPVWLIDSLPFISGGSKFQMYRMAITNPRFRKLREFEFYDEACFVKNGNSTAANQTVLGFGRVLGSYDIRDSDDPTATYDVIPNNEQTGRPEEIVTERVTLTDYWTFAVVVNCWRGENQRSWMVMSSGPVLSVETERLIEDHVRSLGFDMDNVVFLRGRGCRGDGGVERGGEFKGVEVSGGGIRNRVEGEVESGNQGGDGGERVVGSGDQTGPSQGGIIRSEPGRSSQLEIKQRLEDRRRESERQNGTEPSLGNDQRVVGQILGGGSGEPPRVSQGGSGGVQKSGGLKQDASRPTNSTGGDSTSKDAVIAVAGGTGESSQPGNEQIQGGGNSELDKQGGSVQVQVTKVAEQGASQPKNSTDGKGISKDIVAGGTEKSSRVGQLQGGGTDKPNNQGGSVQVQVTKGAEQDANQRTNSTAGESIPKNVGAAGTAESSQRGIGQLQGGGSGEPDSQKGNEELQVTKAAEQDAIQPLDRESASKDAGTGGLLPEISKLGGEQIQERGNNEPQENQLANPTETSTPKDELNADNILGLNLPNTVDIIGGALRRLGVVVDEEEKSGSQLRQDGDKPDSETKQTTSPQKNSTADPLDIQRRFVVIVVRPVVKQIVQRRVPSTGRNENALKKELIAKSEPLRVNQTEQTSNSKNVSRFPTTSTLDRRNRIGPEFIRNRSNEIQGSSRESTSSERKTQSGETRQRSLGNRPASVPAKIPTRGTTTLRNFGGPTPPPPDAIPTSLLDPTSFPRGGRFRAGPRGLGWVAVSP